MHFEGPNASTFTGESAPPPPVCFVFASGNTLDVEGQRPRPRPRPRRQRLRSDTGTGRCASANAARHFRRPRIAASGQGGIKIRVQDAVHLIKTYRKRCGLGIVSVGRQSRGRQRRSISRNYCKHLLMNAHEPPSIGSKSTRPQRAPRREAWASPGCHTTPTTGPQRVHCPQ